jgi:diguanylate cyclase (GGDEF)-like protein/PAS domain S-box-containing protein
MRFTAFVRGSLGWRFTFIAAGVALAVATLTAGASYWLAHRVAERDARSTLAGLIEAVRNTAAVGAYAADQVLLDEVANGLIHHPMVGAVNIELHQGLKVQRRRASAAGAASAAAPPEVAVPLLSPFDATETLGRLQVVVEPEALAREARGQALMVAGPMLLQVLLLTGVLSVVAARLLSRPMARLARQVASLEPGTAERLDVPPQHRRNEIGRLVRRINDLLQANATALDRERELRGEVTVIEGRLRRLLDSSSAAIFLLDGQGRLVQGNPTLVRLCTGSADADMPAEHFVGEQFAQPEGLHALLHSALAEGQSLSTDQRLRRPGADGNERWVHLLLSPLAGDGGVPLLEGVLYDVTQRRHDEQRAHHQAQHDALTGLRNRAGLVADLDRAIAAAQAGDGALSLLYLDLDGFKAVNDARGHEAGDLVLREVARRLQQLVRRAGDSLARMGGDEFVLLLQAAPDEAWVLELGWRVTRLLAEPIALPGDGGPARVGASVGLAGLPRDAHDRDGLLRQADLAMYQVKRAGKNGVATPQGPLTEPG